MCCFYCFGFSLCFFGGGSLSHTSLLPLFCSQSCCLILSFSLWLSLSLSIGTHSLSQSLSHYCSFALLLLLSILLSHFVNCPDFFFSILLSQSYSLSLVLPFFRSHMSKVFILEAKRKTKYATKEAEAVE